MSTSSDSDKRQLRIDIIHAVRTPLGFFVLVVLVVEALLATVASLGQGLDRTLAIVGMLGIIVALIGTVAFMAVRHPEALSGKRAADGAGAGKQTNVHKIRLTFKEMVDIKRLDQWTATCTFVDSTKVDLADEKPVSLPIVNPEKKDPFINLIIPPGKDCVYITVADNITVAGNGRSYSGSLYLPDRSVTLEQN